MKTPSQLTSIDHADLQRASGGNRFTEWFSNLIGYAGPPAASEAAAAIQPAAGAAALIPQGRNRNALIRDLAQNGGNYSESNFTRYNTGKAAQLARSVGKW